MREPCYDVIPGATKGRIMMSQNVERGIYVHILSEAGGEEEKEAILQM